MCLKYNKCFSRFLQNKRNCRISDISSTEILLKDAKKLEKQSKLGDEIKVLFMFRLTQEELQLISKTDYYSKLRS